MNIADLTLHNILDTTSQVYHYYIPNYQREYAWKKENWDALLEDIQENPIGHFMGSLISLKQDTSHGFDQIYDVVDGQQRLTTISILLMAIHQKYKSFSQENDDDDDLILNRNALRKYLIRIKNNPQEGENSILWDDGKAKFLRVKPTSQNHNLEDYIYLLYEIGILKNEPEFPKNWGNRRFVKAYRFFLKTLPEERGKLENILNRVQNLHFILITADDPSMAYRMFETLNNRGIPLTPVDIIKNQILSKLVTKQQGKLNDDYAFNKWKTLISYLSEDVQIRFFRQYYNVYQFEKIAVNKEAKKTILQTKGLSKATQSNLTLAFKNAITVNANLLLENLIKRAKIYSQLLNPEQLNEISESLKVKLKDLSRVGAAPAYASLMLLWESEVLDEDEFEKVIDLYIKYFIRRNLTDQPPTRDLDTVQIELCKKIFEKIDLKESIDYEWVKTNLFKGRGEPASIENLREALSGDIYENSRDSARFVLIKIEETQHTREYKPDLWERNSKGVYIWTIEHILPQDEDIKPAWVQMIANGDKDDAYDIWYDWVDTIGNLSLSGYNSRLSNSSFDIKQKKQSVNVHGQTINIGYKNGLYLNNIDYLVKEKQNSLSTAQKWDKDHIEARGNVLIEKAIDLFRFENEVE
jgi:uncharacterized protein with ParB-like and HNH nuclease domain